MSSAVDLSAGENSDGNEYLTFMVSGEEFAVSIMQVREILEFRDLTIVPMVPGFIQGAINLRGSVVPVIGMAHKFSLEVSDITRRTCIVIVEVELDGEATEMGVIVDKVLQVMEIPDQDIEAAPGFGAKIRTEFIRGMGKVDGRFIILLDVNRVLSIDEIAVTANVKNEQGNSTSVEQGVATNA